MGLHVALGLVADGWRVVAGVRDPAAAEDALGGRPGLVVARMDVTRPGEVAAAVARAEDLAGGAPSCVVVNAAHAVLGAAEEADLAVVAEMFETNLFGAAGVVQAAVPAMRRAGRGAVVLVSSISARQPIPLLGYYSASKAALGALAEALAIELRPSGVRVHVVEPGAIRTDFGLSTRPTGAALAGDGPYAGLAADVRVALRGLRERFSLGPEEVAGIVVRAARDPSTPFRTVVGDDARASDRARDAGSFEAYQDELLGLLGVDWPRVEPPAVDGLDLRGAGD